MSTDLASPSSPTGPEPRQRHRRRLHPLVIGLVSTALSIVAGAFAALAWVSLVDRPPRAEGPEPEFTLRFTAEDAEPPEGPDVAGATLPGLPFDRLDGGEGAFADYRGKPLVVNVWASTCAPCVAEMPDLEQVSTEHAGHVAFLGLALHDTPEASRAMVEQTGVRYDIGLDPDGRVVAELGAPALPSTFFVDSDGRVVDVRPGAMKIDEIRERVEALLR